MRKIDRTGERAIMNNGLHAVITAYRNATDIDIEFNNGGAVYHNTYQHFKNGNIKCPMSVQVIGDYAKIINPNTRAYYLIDIDDICLVEGKWTHINGNGYAQTNIGGKEKEIHRIIVNAPTGIQVDHVNGNKLDNRKSNLRLCTNAENMRNKSKRADNSSGYKGVYWHNQSQRWRAKIALNGKHIHLGNYKNKRNAACAYNYAAQKYHGEFAKLNDIPPE